ncbi:MAG: YggS family pyridoxal phosphate-dependent enzyme [Candidatus Erginobacter occultus]|nr:YggS family pyridoxal phosphate-dependent enzyme [Candidatus Erginobacter occultus]
MIEEMVKKLRAEIPAGVRIEAAAKTRSPEEISQAVAAGIDIIGENYVQELLAVRDRVQGNPAWHFIGHLQTNKVKKIVGLVDMIETVDSLKLAKEIEKRAEPLGKVMKVLIEVNSGREEQKAGVFPEAAVGLIEEIARLPHLSVRGLMTMGPLAGDPEEARPYFRATRELFEKLKASPVPGAEMEILSMGMTNSYRVAVSEGANLVRIGTGIFGTR